MKVINNTEYRTIDLKKVITQVMGRMAKVEGALPSWQKRDLEVEIVHSKERI